MVQLWVVVRKIAQLWECFDNKQLLGAGSGTGLIYLMEIHQNGVLSVRDINWVELASSKQKVWEAVWSNATM